MDGGEGFGPATEVFPASMQSFLARASFVDVQPGADGVQTLAVVITDTPGLCAAAQAGSTKAGAKALVVMVSMPTIMPGTYSFVSTPTRYVGASFYEWNAQCAPAV